MVRSRAFRSDSWPSIMLSHSGVLASSKSASQTLAPELRALMVIFRSVGPVISTRRSSRPGAGLATRQTAAGRHVYAVGDNREAARLTGIPDRRLLLTVYTVAGAIYGLAG